MSLYWSAQIKIPCFRNILQSFLLRYEKGHVVAPERPLSKISGGICTCPQPLSKMLSELFPQGPCMTALSLRVDQRRSWRNSVTTNKDSYASLDRQYRYGMVPVRVASLVNVSFLIVPSCCATTYQPCCLPRGLLSATT